MRYGISEKVYTSQLITKENANNRATYKWGTWLAAAPSRTPTVGLERLQKLLLCRGSLLGCLLFLLLLVVFWTFVAHFLLLSANARPPLVDALACADYSMGSLLWLDHR
jgi:hypothetical protein